MKGLILVGLMVMFGAARAQAASCVIFQSNACIVDSAESEFVIDVHYPNYLTCGLEIWPANGETVTGRWMMENLREMIKVVVRDQAIGQDIEEPLTVHREDVKLVMDVGPNTLVMAPVIFSTRSGEPLSKVVADNLGTGGKLVVTPVSCGD